LNASTTVIGKALADHSSRAFPERATLSRPAKRVGV
jgi:hypothetical protein